MTIFSFFNGKKSSGIFIPDGLEFKELKDFPTGKSINDITKHLGYNIDQVHTCFNNDGGGYDVTNVVVEIFTRNVVFVITKDTVLKLSNNKVDHFFRKFDLSEEFNSSVTNDILEDGIKNKTLRIEFLARVLNIKNPEPDGLFNVPSLGLNLSFSNGYLTEILSADGLNEWARSWKEINPEFIEKYQIEAEHYWGSDISKAIKEINTQAEAYADTPEALRNKFVELHRSKFGNVNFVMLLVCHYNKQISLEQFLEINHGRYTEDIHEIGIKKYTLQNFTFEFSSSGSLLSVIQGGN